MNSQNPSFKKDNLKFYLSVIPMIVPGYFIQVVIDKILVGLIVAMCLIIAAQVMNTDWATRKFENLFDNSTLAWLTVMLAFGITLRLLIVIY